MSEQLEAVIGIDDGSGLIAANMSHGTPLLYF
jgi:hypothetical protein